MTRGGKITLGVMIVAVLAAAVVVAGHYGRIPGCDFGAGQYYYTDIPGWERIFGLKGVEDGRPRALYFALFLGWGGLMYLLWRWVDRP